MKNIVSLVICFSLALISVSCNKFDGGAEVNGARTASLSVRLDNIVETKATGISTGLSADKKIKSLIVIIFDENGNTELAHQAAADEIAAGECEVKVTVGIKTIWAVANASPILCSKINSAFKKNDLKGVISNLADDNTIASSTASLLMVGNIGGNDGTVNVIVPSSGSPCASCSISLRRLVSKVAIQKITNAIESPLIWKGADLKVKKIYLINSVVKSKLGDSYNPTSNSDFVNQMKWNGAAPDILLDDFSSSPVQISNGNAYSKTYAYFTYPNSVTTDKHTVKGEDSFSPRFTRLALECELLKGDAKQSTYYSVSLPGLEANKVYTITNLKVLREGSPYGPDDDRRVDEVAVSFTVADWSTGRTEEVEY